MEQKQTVFGGGGVEVLLLGAYFHILGWLKEALIRNLKRKKKSCESGFFWWNFIFLGIKRAFFGKPTKKWNKREQELGGGGLKLYFSGTIITYLDRSKKL